MLEKVQKRLNYMILIGPAVLIYAMMIIFPIIYVFGLSMTNYAGVNNPIKFIGLHSYIQIFTDPFFLHGLRNNMLIIGISVFGQIPLGFVLAYIIYRKMVKGTSFFEPMIFFPITISVVVVGILWSNVFSPNGVLTKLVGLINHDPRFVFTIFESREYAIIPILIVILWMYTGLYMVIFIANLQKISPSVIEAAIIDGATEMQILWRIILPSMVNILFTTLIFAISGSLRSFDLIYAMTGGGPARYTEVIAIYMYLNTFKYYKYGFGSAVSVIIILLSFIFIRILEVVFNKLEKKFE